MEDFSLLCETLIPLFWTKALVILALGFKARVDSLLLRLTSGATPADLLVASMVAESLFDAYTCMHMYKHCWGWYPGLSMLLPHSV